MKMGASRDSSRTIADVMTRDIERVGPDATVMEAARMMKQHDTGILPVCDGERLMGVVTDRDVTVRATAEGRDPGSTRVRDIMTREVLCCRDSENLDDAARAMQQGQVRRLAVVDGAQRLVGMLSMGDLAREMHDPALESRVLEGVSKPGGSHHA